MEPDMKQLLSSHIYFFLSCLLSINVLLSCDNNETQSADPDPSIPYLSSDLERNMSPDVTQDDLNQLITGNTQFAIDLYRQNTSNVGNIIYSPYSFSLAMAMAYGGAAGNTAAEIADAFHFTLPADDFHPAFNSVDLALLSRPFTNDETGKTLKLTIANAFWGQTDYHFEDSYLDLLAVNYGAGIYLLDFFNQPEACRQTINDWIDNKTEGLIKDAIGPNSITSGTRLVLANVIYFYANWLKEFKKALTASAPFYLADGTEVTADTMHQTDYFKYYADADVTAIELPYAGNKMSMIIAMPAAGNFAAFESSITPSSLNSLISGMTSTNISLAMPKFEIEFTMGEIKGKLTDMGMADAFNSLLADFSGITGGRDLLISDIIHKAVIKVEETGTEAAAVTVIVMEALCIPEPPVEVSLNRPFLFFIRDMETGAILFMGRLLDPTE